MQTHTFTEQQEIDIDLDLWSMERDWLASRPKLEEAQWLNIFPQAKNRYGKLIKGKLKIEKKYLIAEAERVRSKAIKETLSNPPSSAWRDGLIRERRDRSLHYIQKRINTIGHLLTLISPSGKKGNSDTTKVTPEMIARAKEYPLEKLVEINRAGFTKCFKHDDKHPSALARKNFIHCFVCNKSWDTIAVLVERDGMTFKQAVIQLQ